jgi:hypothetical protein
MKIYSALTAAQKLCADNIDKIEANIIPSINSHHISGAIMFGSLKARRSGNNFVIFEDDLRTSAQQAGLNFNDAESEAIQEEVLI